MKIGLIINKALKKFLRLFVSKKRHVYNYRLEKSAHWRDLMPFHQYWWEKWGDGRYFMLYVKLRSWFIRKPWIISMDWMLTTYCTLACKDCSHYVTHFDKISHLKPVSFERFKEELDALLSCVDKIYLLQIVGGETLMVKDLPRIIDYAASTGKICHVMPITNGTIVPDDELLRVLVKHKKVVHLQVSDYSNNEKLRDKLKYDEVINKLRDWGAMYVKLSSDKNWLGVPELVPCFDEGRARRNYKLDCIFSRCLHSFDGLLEICPFHGYAVRTGILEDIKLQEYLSLKQLKTGDLFNWLSKPYYKLCGHCHVDNIPRPSAIQKEGMKCSH